MANESMLQKDFKSRDIQRMRNIISKNYSDKTVTQSGYTKQSVEHKEGDVWEENGKQWTIKKGIKQNLTRFDKLKESIMLPIVCPLCSQAMKSTSVNKKMWPIHKMCFDCVIVMETELKRDGKFEEYQRNMMIGGAKTHLKEMEEILLEVMLDTGNESIVTENGDIENWSGGNIDNTKIIKDLQNYIQKLKDIVGY